MATINHRLLICRKNVQPLVAYTSEQVFYEEIYEEIYGVAFDAFQKGLVLSRK